MSKHVEDLHDALVKQLPCRSCACSLIDCLIPKYSSSVDVAEMPPDVHVAVDDFVVDYHILDVDVIRVIGLVQLK